MTLVATLGITLFAWINSTLANLNRIGEHMRRETATDNALAFMQTINPMQEPQGERLVGTSRIKWTSKPLTGSPRRSRSIALNIPGWYELNLFTVTISVFEETLLLAEFEIQAVGYRQLERSLHNLK